MIDPLDHVPDPEPQVLDFARLETELYDAVVLPGVRQPMAVGFQTNEIERLLLLEEDGEL